MTTYFKRCKMHENLGNSFKCHGQENDFPSKLNGVF